MADSLRDRLMAASGNKLAAIYSESKYTDKSDSCIQTSIPMLNVALSGHWDGGLMYGITIIAGPSKHFKTQTGLYLVKGFQDKYPDGVVVLLDSELGQGIQSMNNIGIDVDKIVHIPVTNIEEAKIQVVSMLESLKDGEKVMFFYDSIGNTASKKELEDAIEGKSVADMSRAKAIKSFFRIITPMINLKKVYFVAINHTYKSMDLFPKDIMGGGCLEEGTLIRCDGGTKPIEEIKVGDYVDTLDGMKRVEATWDPLTLDDGCPECYEIEFEDGTKVVCSDVHKFIVNGEWLEAKQLQENMEVTSVFI
jgi:hypothetical protein